MSAYKDVISWNGIIQAHITNGQTNEALHLFRKMASSGILPDEYTYSIILKDLSDLDEGKRIHELLKVCMTSFSKIWLSHLHNNRSNTHNFSYFLELL